MKYRASKFKITTKSLVISSILATFPFGAITVAETLPMPISQQGSHNVETPRNGLDKASVESMYGEPVQRISSVGAPPISKWVYQEYTVYFEYDLVLHSVIHKN
ncbi:MAG: hypothetical protein KUG78_13865 [Kangiellaceae bacterium]|nr:hypothetical protein [Kangiellaceae bacterium]